MDKFPYKINFNFNLLILVVSFLSKIIKQMYPNKFYNFSSDISEKYDHFYLMVGKSFRLFIKVKFFNSTYEAW